MAHDGTGENWDGAAPEGTDAVYLGAKEIRDLRLGTEFRIAMEHVQPDDTHVGGSHLPGSAKAYSQDAAPTTRPDSVNDPYGDGATTLTADDDGRMWVDENAGVGGEGWFYVLTSGGTPTWTPIGSMLGGTLDLDNVNPEFTIWATQQENADGGRESHIIWKGEKNDGTVHEQARITVQCDVGEDDYLSEMVLLINNGNDAVGSLTEMFRVNTTDGLVMNSKKITGLADGTNATDALAAGQVDGATIQLDGSNDLETINYGRYAKYSNTQTANTAGGTATKDAWQKYPLNTEDVDASSIGAIASNQVTIATTGVYRFTARAVFRRTGNSRIRIRNTTTNATIATSNNANAMALETATDQKDSIASGKAAVTANDVIELQYYTEKTVTTTGLGQAMNKESEAEIYGTLEIEGTVAG